MTESRGGENQSIWYHRIRPHPSLNLTHGSAVYLIHFLGIVECERIELQGEFEFATPVGAGGAEGLLVGRYGGLVGSIDEQGPAMGRKKVIQLV